MSSSDVEQSLPQKEGEKEPQSDAGDVIAPDQESGDKNAPPATVITDIAAYPEGGFRAWSVVAGCACILFCTFGYGNAFGVYQEYYATHQLRNETPSAISWIGSLQVFFLFGGALFGGPLFDRYGAKVIWPPAITYIFSVMITSICKKYWHFLLAQGILGGFCMGMSMGPAMAATGQYFFKKRGAAMGLAVAGSSLGGVIFPIALSKMLYNPSLSFGWTVRIIGFIMLALILPACLSIRARLPPRAGKFFLPSAFKNLVFLAIIGAVFLTMLGLFTPLFYLPTYAVDHGMSTLLASYLLSILNGASFIGRVVPGILADKLGPLNMMFLAALGTGILILVWQVITSNAGIIVFAVLYGFFSGAIVSLMTFALATCAPNPQDIGTYLGMGMALVSFAVLIGPPINGALVNRFHGFDQSFDMSGVFVVAGAFIILVAKYASGKGMFAKN